MTKVTYLVDASHPLPQYTFHNTPVKVTKEPEAGGGGFYADHPKLGCGRIYSAPESAIRGLFANHGYKVTKMAKAD